MSLTDLTELIQSRRSIYPPMFTGEKIDDEVIKRILANANQAPSHKKTNPWRFHVFMKDGKNKLSSFLGKTYLETIPKEKVNDQKLAKLIRRPLLSSVVIAVSMSRQKEETILELEEIEAVACAIQNMHLSCTAYGLGGFWSTPKLIYTQEMNTFLGIESKDKCLGLFYIGYPKSTWPEVKHRKPLEYNTTWIEA